jgi:hypothetical protein
MRCGRRCDACPLVESLSLQVALKSLVAHSRLPSPKGTRNSLEQVPMIPCIVHYPMLLAVQHRTSRRGKSALGASLLALDIDNAECRFLRKFEDVACLACQESNAAVVFTLDQVLTTVIADELDAVARASVRVLIFALEGKSFDNSVEANVWLVPVTVLA